MTVAGACAEGTCIEPTHAKLLTRAQLVQHIWDRKQRTHCAKGHRLEPHPYQKKGLRRWCPACARAKLKRFTKKGPGCWLFTGGCVGKKKGQSGPRGGYGLLGPNLYAHRVALERKLGRPLKPKHFALHTCDNPPCVRPGHLYEGTVKDNAKDAVRRGRTVYGERNAGAKLTWAKVRRIRKLAASGTTQDALAQRFKVSQAAISHVVLNRRWVDKVKCNG